MTTSPATSLCQALDFQPSSGPLTTLSLPSDIGIGNGWVTVTIGGYVIGDNTVGFVIDTGRSVILSKLSGSAEKTLYLKF
ncbi:hypothetical protein BDV32DRAFT_154548 [Aspergillus pseudonomiae]|uniref:Uncharacterized protein n=1 Tax=Aspergillus pseudonomiae TaxID=1506151 RepID=A0A5N6HMQ1_9EURO|nr:uncharacterized protein BDV37DRAFT_289285 [Aspergillus pseudonomiae]KAB8255134.1 hypothetical protein BDV32DRAFT_154548 [Aspergillus pseudonomiae]KAE8397582.1 hypothetical protein BDV37DRAFT_289285 [Aspergillus pseudonomiae]